MVSLFRREENRILSIQADPVEVLKVWISSLLASVRTEQHRTGLLIHLHDLRDHSLAGCDLALELSRRQIIEVKLPPVVPL